jgi:hypothetical protein
MPTRRATRRQRGGFLGWLFGSSNATANATTASNDKKTGYNAANGTNSSANATISAAPVGGRRKTRKGRKASKRSKRSRRH